MYHNIHKHGHGHGHGRRLMVERTRLFSLHTARIRGKRKEEGGRRKVSLEFLQIEHGVRGRRPRSLDVGGTERVCEREREKTKCINQILTGSILAASARRREGKAKRPRIKIRPCRQHTACTLCTVTWHYLWKAIGPYPVSFHQCSGPTPVRGNRPIDNGR